MSAPKHGWHTLDAERGLTVRQVTNRFRKNRWQVRRAGREVVLGDADFDRLRREPEWLPEGLL